MCPRRIVESEEKVTLEETKEKTQLRNSSEPLLTSQEEQPKASAPLNRLDEEMRKLPVEYDVIAHLRRIPARLSIYEALQLSKEAREALINALVNESVRDVYLAESDLVIDDEQAITFTEDDMLLRNADHNRPLFVTGDLAGERINRIMLGSAVNILPLKT